MITQLDLITRFTYYSPREGEAEFYLDFRGRALELAEFLLEHAPDSRELALAITKLEECVMWGNAAVARGGLLGSRPTDWKPTPHREEL